MVDKVEIKQNIESEIIIEIEPNKEIISDKPRECRLNINLR
jgi:hypothetical protein